MPAAEVRWARHPSTTLWIRCRRLNLTILSLNDFDDLSAIRVELSLDEFEVELGFEIDESRFDAAPDATKFADLLMDMEVVEPWRRKEKPGIVGTSSATIRHDSYNLPDGGAVHQFRCPPSQTDADTMDHLLCELPVDGHQATSST